MIKNLAELTQQASGISKRSILELFTSPNRAQNLSVSSSGLYLDYSKQNITSTELNELCVWAQKSTLAEKISSLFSGQKLNNTEGRAVLHSVLRAPDAVKVKVLKEDAAEVQQTEKRMAEIVDGVSSGKLLSASGEKFTDVLAIGIGGSYYGIKVGLTALQPYNQTGLNVHVLANIDGGAVQEKIDKLPVNTTLVIVISKTFTTQETLLNANTIKKWMNSASLYEEVIKKQWFAVSSNVAQANDFGICSEHILPMWDWVGGRFSLWSAVGLPLALAIGNEGFSRLKSGAYAMDKHFNTSSFEKNMPVLMALLGIWNRNGLNLPSLAILPYDHALRALPGYLQQTDMESNGKSVANNGDKLSWQTAPVVFGQEGTNGQHAFMQLMHQSDDIIPTDFLLAVKGSSQLTEHHAILAANCFAQSEALMQGKTLEQALAELLDQGMPLAQAQALAPHKVMKGNTPSNTILLDELSPESFGALLALYEHKIFVQGILWEVNSFDQWGVELGKELGKKVQNLMNGDTNEQLSDSSISLINKFNLSTKS
ncbi:glucose-6-phosphate isomerase [bacterium]|nr:glucose-6-phosphate isomerase [bacterium]